MSRRPVLTTTLLTPPFRAIRLFLHPFPAFSPPAATAWLVAIVWLLAGVSTAQAQKLDAARLARIDRIVNDAIGQSKLSGAVVVVGAGNRVVYRKAFGLRAVEPAREAMTLDTVFDAASLTKVVATTPSVMALVEEGRLRLNDRVSTYVPGFERYGKRDITIRHLLTHTSGLRPDVDLTFDWMGAPRAIELAVEEVPLARPDERFIYSDINFFLLGHIVATVSGMSLDQFARTRIFEPLEMRDTTFLPPEAWRERIAPTEKCTPYGFPCSGPGVSASGLQMLRGVVHDPTARRMGGVAGHAGLFTTADDLAIYCRMLLRGGAAASGRVLAPLTVARMISASTPVGERNVRGLGLGHRLELLVEPRRAAAARIVRPHRLHRHVDLDRSAHARCSWCFCRAGCTPTARAT